MYRKISISIICLLLVATLLYAGTEAIYWHRGKKVSAVTNGYTVTTADGADTAFVAEDEGKLEDATGFNAPVVMTTITDGTTVGVEGAGWGVNIDATYDAEAANNTVLQATTEDINISCWVLLNVGGGNQAGILKVAANGVDGYQLLFLSGKAEISIRDGADTYRLDGNTDLRDGTWHYVAAVIDRDAEANCKIFLDGSEDGVTNKTGTLADVDSITNTGTFIIGTRNGGLRLDGKISDAKILIAAGAIWSDAEIAYQAANPFDVSASAGTITDSWPLDEGTGTTINGAVNDLTLSNAAAWARGIPDPKITRVGKSLGFNGSSDNIDCGNDASLGITAAITLAAWIKPEVNAVAGIISKINGAGVGAYGLWMNTFGRIRIIVDDPLATFKLARGTGLKLNIWQHVVGTYDGATLRLYINAKEVDNTGYVGTINTSGVALKIGSINGGVFFNGNIRGVVVASAAATAADVLQMATNPGQSLTELVAGTSFALGDIELKHDYSKGVLTDETANGNDGAHSGTPSYETAAFLSRNHQPNPGWENFNLGSLESIGSNIVVTPEDTIVNSDEASIEIVWSSADDGDEVTAFAPFLVDEQDYYQTTDVNVTSLGPNSQLFLDVDGAGNVISRPLAGVGDNGEWIGGVLEFDGAEYVDIAEAANLRPVTFTVVVWFRSTENGAFQGIVSHRSFSPDNGYELTKDNDDFLRFMIEDGGVRKNVKSDVAYTDTNWHCFVGVFDGDLKIYVDGALQVNTNTNTLTHSTEGMTIGRLYVDVADSILTGSISTVQLFSIALTQGDVDYLFLNPGATVAEIYANTTATEGGGGDVDGELVLFHNYGTGALADLSGYGNDGTHSGAPSYSSEWSTVEHAWQADQNGEHNISIEIAGEPPIVADNFTLTTGSVESGDITSTYTQNITDLHIDETGGSPAIDIEFDFSGASEAKSFNFFGHYDGNLGHTVNVNAWDGGSYDLIGTIPDGVADALHTFTLTDEHTQAGAVNIQILHTSEGNPNHNIHFDHVYLVDSNEGTLYLDSGLVILNLVAQGGCEAADGNALPAGWSDIGGEDADETQTDDSDKHSGDTSILLNAADDGEGATQSIMVISGVYYTIEFYEKNNSQDVDVVLGNAVTETIDATGDNTWTNHGFTFLTTTTTLTVSLVSGAATQTGWFDDVRVTRLDTVDADTETKTPGYYPRRNPLRQP